MFEKLTNKGFQIRQLHHAEAILKHDLPLAAAELESALEGLALPVSELVYGGGGEGELTQRLRKSLSEKGWKKHKFEIRKIVDGVEKESVSHEVDHVRKLENGVFALEIEWNNKDPFFDRDLENFKRLHAEGAISIGGIITRGSSLQERLSELIVKFAERHSLTSLEAVSKFYTPTPRQKSMIERAAEKEGSFVKGWSRVFVADKFGEATTHWKKLEDRVNRGVGNPCPLLLIGLPAEIVKTDE